MALYLDQQRVAVGGDLLAQRIGIHTIAHRDASNPQLMLSGVSTSLRHFFAFSAAIALNIRPRVCLTVATPFDRMACKVKSWLITSKSGRHPLGTPGAYYSTYAPLVFPAKYSDNFTGFCISIVP